MLAEIRPDLAESPFVGEGNRKVWAHLRRWRGPASAGDLRMIADFTRPRMAVHGHAQPIGCPDGSPA